MVGEKHKAFISYHHANDQGYRQALTQLNDRLGIFVDKSVDTGDIDERLNDQAIREKIRDYYLADTSVTILLVGTKTKGRKHVDWEIYSSMYDGKINKRSGILVINLPTTGCSYYTAAHGNDEKRLIYPGCTSWTTVSSRAEFERRYPHMPARIIDNLLEPKAKVSVTNWETVTGNVERLRFLIEATFNDRTNCEYDLGRPMRRSDAPEAARTWI